MEQRGAAVRIVILPQEELLSLEMKCDCLRSLEGSCGAVDLIGFD